MKDNWTIFDTYPSESEAAIFVDALRNAGIPAVTENGTLSSVFALPTASFSQVKVLVPEALLEKARALISEG